MSDSRPSLPPGDDSLAKVAAHHRARNDDHERLVAGEPTPLAIRVASVELTDEQRIACVREINALIRRGGASAYKVLEDYELAARKGLGR